MKTQSTANMFLLLSLLGVAFLAGCASDGAQDPVESVDHHHMEYFYGDHVHHGYPAHSHMHAAHTNESTEPPAGIEVEMDLPDGPSLDEPGDPIL